MAQTKRSVVREEMVDKTRRGWETRGGRGPGREGGRVVRRCRRQENVNAGGVLAHVAAHVYRVSI